MKKHLPVISAFGNSVWSAALQLIAVRVYVLQLGIEAYGVIGFFLALQAALQILDLGLAPAVNRELAQAVAVGEISTARTLLKTLSRLYWFVGAGIGFVLVLSASPISSYWLSAQKLSPSELRQALMLMALVLAARWPISVYQNAIIGLGRIGTASLLAAAMNTMTILTSVLVLSLVHASLSALFVSQAVCALVYAVVARIVAWRVAGGFRETTIDIRSLRRIWRFSAAMGGVTLTGIAITQIDKALLSTVLSLPSFGEYMLAATVAGSLSLFISPLFSIVFPRFSAMLAKGDFDGLKKQYQEGAYLFASVFFPIATAISLYAYDIVTLWTNKHEVAVRISPIIALLSLGTALNGIMTFPYAIQLAGGKSHIPLIINLILIGPLAVLVFLLAQKFGAVGAAAAWPITEFAYLFIGTFTSHRIFKLGSAPKWILLSVARPATLCILFSAILYQLISLLPAASILKLIGIGLSIPLISLLVTVSVSDIRKTFAALLFDKETSILRPTVYKGIPSKEVNYD